MQVARRNTVDIDTRRNVFMLVKTRAKDDITKVPHEAFIRQTLKAKLGWAKNEPAPEHIKAVAREMAKAFNDASLKAQAEQDSRDAAVAHGIADAL